MKTFREYCLVESVVFDEYKKIKEVLKKRNYGIRNYHLDKYNEVEEVGITPPQEKVNNATYYQLMLYWNYVVFNCYSPTKDNDGDIIMLIEEQRIDFPLEMWGKDEKYEKIGLFVDGIFDNIQKLIIEFNLENIEYIDNPTQETQLLTVQRDPKNIKYIKNPTREVQELALSKLGAVGITWINNPDKEFVAKYGKMVGLKKAGWI